MIVYKAASRIRLPVENVDGDKKSDGKAVGNVAEKGVNPWKTPVYSWISNEGLRGVGGGIL